GLNILYLSKPLEALEKDMPLNMLKDKVSKAVNILFMERKKRVHPHMDDKILADWNGLMIAALALGAKVLDRGYASSAIKAADFIIEQMRNNDGGLLHRYREHEAKINGNADDYAFFIWGLINLYEATNEPRYLEFALELNDYFLAHFCDKERGGFFFTSDDGEPLPVRKREIYDGAIPSSNSAAMLNLLRLGQISKRADLDKYGIDTARAFSDAVKKMPSAHTFLMCGIEFLLT
ncbi:MAG: AGE family epimerase/isomerase, partial [Methanosarcina sp.]|nr:AGE family epimerase/isomerase [Methanosarcina sp.]